MNFYMNCNSYAHRYAVLQALVVGNGTFEKYLSKLKHVSCCGWLSGNALGEAYASSDILLFPR